MSWRISEDWRGLLAFGGEPGGFYGSANGNYYCAGKWVPGETERHGGARGLADRQKSAECSTNFSAFGGRPPAEARPAGVSGTAYSAESVKAGDTGLVTVLAGCRRNIKRSPQRHYHGL